MMNRAGKKLSLALMFCVLASASVACTFLGAGGSLPVTTRPFMQQGTQVLCNHGYAVLVSGVTHTPLWAAEHLSRESIQEAGRLHRAGSFYEDVRWPEGSHLSDFVHSGYTRGHLAPSADQPDPKAQFETFALSNIVPQTASLNQGQWARIERTVRRLARKEGELYVVTGPAFHAAPIPTIGKSGVFVPSSTWKAVYSPRRGRAGVYVCKNVKGPPRCNVVTVATLIRNTGVNPFPALPDTVQHTFWRLPSPRRLDDGN